MASAQEEIVIPVPDFKQLVSLKQSERRKAFFEIQAKDVEMSGRLVHTLIQLKKTPVGNSRGFGEPLELTLKLLGRVGNREAEPHLWSMLEFQLDPKTVNMASSYATIELYPAAFALGQIGDKRTVYNIFEKLRSERSELRLRLYAWILKEILDKDVALILVESKLATENAQLEKSEIKESQYKNNLELIKGFYLSKEPLLIDPVVETKVP